MNPHATVQPENTMNALYFSSLVISALLTGISAGLFYSYACSVNPGLGKLGDAEYLRAMQEINKAILNPLFFISFMGSLLVLGVATWQSYGNNTGTFYWLLAALLLYGIGVFGMTMFANVPLNDRLDQFPVLTATAAEVAAMRKAFEQPWNAYHSIRTVASIVSFVLVLVSLTKHKP